jgi:hypothetical protein
MRADETRQTKHSFQELQLTEMVADKIAPEKNDAGCDEGTYDLPFPEWPPRPSRTDFIRKPFSALLRAIICSDGVTHGFLRWPLNRSGTP